MIARVASVDLRGGTCVISTYHRTRGGHWIAPDAPFVLAGDSSDELIGWRVRAALDASQSHVPTPGPDVDVSRALQATMKVSSWAAYMRGTRSVIVRATEFDDGTETVKVTPQRNGGASNGFTPMNDEAETQPFVSAVLLGAIVRRALSKAR